jgi:ATP/maltotriose-dependent transcriptional regulator MalT
VDPGDADLATFFHYLGQAAAAFTPTGQRQLPALTPEYLADVPSFARRYFRELFRRMPDGGTLVLDNYQEAAPEEQFHSLIADAVAEVPQGLMLVAVSRRDPPDAYARIIANENVCFVDWEDLRLTVPEAQAIAALRSARLEPARVAALHAQCDGWAAGLTLLLEDWHRDLESGDAPSGIGRDALFNNLDNSVVHPGAGTHGQRARQNIKSLQSLWRRPRFQVAALGRADTSRSQR